MDRISDSGSDDWGSTPHGRTENRVSATVKAAETFFVYGSFKPFGKVKLNLRFICHCTQFALSLKKDKPCVLAHMLKIRKL